MIQSDLSLGNSYDELNGEQPFYLLEEQRFLGDLVIGPTGSGRTILLLKIMQQELFEMKQRELYRERLNGLTLITSHTAVSDRVLLAAENADVAQHVLYFNANDKKSIKINPLQGDFNVVVKTFHAMFETFLQSFTTEDRIVLYDALTHGVFLTKYNGETNEGLSVLLECFVNPSYLYEITLKTIAYLEDSENSVFSFENALELKRDLVEWIQQTLVIDDDAIAFQYGSLFEKLSKVLKELIPYTTTVFTEEQTEVDLASFVQKGGVILVNTEFDECETAYGYMIGVHFLSRLESAICSTRSNIFPIHHIVLEQGSQYLYTDFIDSFLPQQSDYHVSVTLAVESLLRIKNTIGDKAVQAIVEYQRNKFVFGGISVYDGRIMEEVIGRKEGQVPRSVSKALMIQDSFHMTTIVGVKQEVKEVKIGYI